MDSVTKAALAKFRAFSQLRGYNPAPDDMVESFARLLMDHSWNGQQHGLIERTTAMAFLARIAHLADERDRLIGTLERAHGIVKDAPIIGRATQITLLAMIDLALTPPGESDV